MKKRLLGAIMDGLGNAAGHALWDGLKKQVESALSEEEKEAEARAAPAAAPPSARELEKQRQQAEKEAALQARKRDRDLDSELAALKRRMAAESKGR